MKPHAAHAPEKAYPACGEIIPLILLSFLFAGRSPGPNLDVKHSFSSLSNSSNDSL